MIFKKALVFFIFSCVCLINMQAQVTNIRFNHDEVNGKYIITYDLAKENRYNYFDIEITAKVNEVDVRPSLAALSGGVGLNIKYGTKKRIVWDYLIDIEKLIGEVTFKVQARRPALPAPPAQTFDLAFGAGLGIAGLGIITVGSLTLFKKGKIDPDASASRDPLIYYQTFCDVESPHFNLSLTEIDNENDSSLCDNHFKEGEAEYGNGVLLASIGGVVVAAGLYVLLAKPFYKPKMKAYQKQHRLAVRPTFQLNQLQPKQAPTGVVGLRLNYQFGR